MKPGLHDPEVFWLPVIADRYHVQAWDMWRVRVVHYEMMLSDLKKRRSLG